MMSFETIQRCRRAAVISRFRLIGVIGIVGLFGVVQAQAGTVAMSTLLAGGSITCGDATFSGFTGFTSNANGGAIAPVSSGVYVTSIDCGTSDPGIQISSANWNVNQNQSMDTSFTYDVTSSGTPISDASLAILSDSATNSSSTPNLGGDIHITESVFNNSATNLGNLLTDYQQNITSQTINFAPVTEVVVNKDISLEGNTDGTATLSTLTQNFSESPEPGTVSMLGLGIIGVALLRARRRRSGDTTARPA